MENHLKWLKIRNFKSIKSVDFDCKRINVFVGRPNVGKSNILEAISMLGGVFPYSDKFGEGMIRYEELENLFFDQDSSNPINVISTIGSTKLSLLNTSPSEYNFLQLTDQNNIAFLKEYRSGLEGAIDAISIIPNFSGIIQGKKDKPEIGLILSEEGNLMNRKDWASPNYKNGIKCFQFEKDSLTSGDRSNELVPPFGRNLFRVLEKDKELWKEVAGFFDSYGLKMILNVKNKEFEIAKFVDHLYYKIPYSLIADTLQRIIFYLAAIRSNENATLIFEEPENHSYPQYVKMLADEMIASETNQFFLTTHNPYLLTTLMTKGGFEDVAVYLTDYKDYQTTVRQLDEKDWDDMLGNRVDIFFNPEWFTEDGKFTNIH